MHISYSATNYSSDSFQFWLFFNLSLLYINCCLSKKAHIIAIMFVAFIRHLTGTNMKSINLVIIFALILHCFLSTILKLASLAGCCLSLESGSTENLFFSPKVVGSIPALIPANFLLESYDQIFISFMLLTDLNAVVNGLY